MAHLEDALLICFSFGSFCSLLALSLQLLGPRQQLPSDGGTHSSHCVIWQGDESNDAMFNFLGLFLPSRRL